VPAAVSDSILADLYLNGELANNRDLIKQSAEPARSAYEGLLDAAAVRANPATQPIARDTVWRSSQPAAPRTCWFGQHTCGASRPTAAMDLIGCIEP